MQRIGFAPRFFAYLIDIVLSLILLWGGSAVWLSLISTSITATASSSGVANVAEMRAALVGYFLVWIFVALPEIILGASPGKLLLGLRIRYEEGSETIFPVLFKRYCFKHLSYVVNISGLVLMGIFACPFGFLLMMLILLGNLAAVVFFLGYLLVLTEDQQALHDKFAGTAVYSHKALTEELIQSQVAATAKVAKVETHSDPNDLFKPRW